MLQFLHVTGWPKSKLGQYICHIEALF